MQEKTDTLKTPSPEYVAIADELLCKPTASSGEIFNALSTKHNAITIENIVGKKLDEQKGVFYGKLLKKLHRMRDGDLSLEDYITEVTAKVKSFEEARNQEKMPVQRVQEAS